MLQLETNFRQCTVYTGSFALELETTRGEPGMPRLNGLESL
jgi:hypothetical protein